MQYPKVLKEHAKVKYLHEDCFKNNENNYVKSYFHHEKTSLDMHCHSFYEINIVLSGKGRHYIEDKSCDVSPGAVFVIPPDIRHGYYAVEELNIFHVLLSSVFFERYANELGNLPGFTILFDIEPYIRSNFNKSLFLFPDDLSLINKIIDDLIECESVDYSGKEIMKNSMALYLICVLAKLVLEKNSSEKVIKSDMNAMLIIKSMEYINTHYGKKLSIEMLAKKLNMSRSTYIRHFEMLCNCSPAEYILKCRIKKAKQLLKYSDFKIVDIAMQCGFYDSSHFVKAFTKHEGISPMEFKKF